MKRDGEVIYPLDTRHAKSQSAHSGSRAEPRQMSGHVGGHAAGRARDGCPSIGESRLAALHPL